MPQNKLSDLNNHLFAALERLNVDAEDVDKDILSIEIKKAQAVAKVASQIINNSKLVLDAAKMVSRGDITQEALPNNLIENKIQTL